VSNNFFQDWQIGWTGGMMTTLPLLAEGTPQTKERVLKNFDWLFAKGVSPSGYYYGTLYKEKAEGDFPNKPLGRDLDLVRKNADATYYIFKQFDLMQKMNIPVNDEWKKGNLNAVDAQIKTWEKYGQLGQFVNEQTGELIIGNTSSAGIFTASLCADCKQTGDQKYLKTAEEIGEYYYQNFISKGLSCCGPGDAMQSVELPGVYVNLDTKQVFALDHIKASITKSAGGKVSLALTNTTMYDAKVKLLAESKEQEKIPLGMNAFLNWPKVGCSGWGSKQSSATFAQ